MAGAAAGCVTSFFLTTLRFAVVFFAFLEDFSPFFFAIGLLDDAAAYMPSKRHAERKKGEERRRSLQRHQHYPCTPSLWRETRRSSCDGNSKRQGATARHLDAVLLWQTPGKDKFVTVEVTFYLRYLSARREDSSEAARPPKSIPAIALLLMPLFMIFLSPLLFLSSPRWQAGSDSIRCDEVAGEGPTVSNTLHISQVDNLNSARPNFVLSGECVRFG